MAIESIIIGIFLFVALSVGACRAVDMLRSAPTSRQVKPTRYSGPVYSRHGNEVE